jgi:hypothetical protein
MTQETVRFSVNIYVKEGKVAISFGLHSELNGLVDAVQVVKEVLKLVGSVWPDDKSVVHVAKPAEGLRYMDRIVREAIEIELHPNNMNREMGFCLSSSWKPLVCSLKKHPEHDARSTRLSGQAPV